MYFQSSIWKKMKIFVWSLSAPIWRQIGSRSCSFRNNINASVTFILYQKNDLSEREQFLWNFSFNPILSNSFLISLRSRYSIWTRIHFSFVSSIFAEVYKNKKEELHIFNHFKVITALIFSVNTCFFRHLFQRLCVRTQLRHSISLRLPVSPIYPSHSYTNREISVKCISNFIPYKTLSTTNYRVTIKANLHNSTIVPQFLNLACL